MNPIMPLHTVMHPHQVAEDIHSHEEKMTIQEYVAVNNFEQVEHYIKEGGDPYIIDDEGKSLMFYAATDEMLDILCDLSLNPDEVLPCGFSAWDDWLRRLKRSRDDERASACSLITRWLPYVDERSGPQWKKRLADLNDCLGHLIYFGREHEIRWLVAAAAEGGYLFESLPGEKLCFGLKLLSKKGMPFIHSRLKMGLINLQKPNSDGCTPYFYALIDALPFEKGELNHFEDLQITLPRLEHFQKMNEGYSTALLLAAWKMACDPYHFGKILLRLCMKYKDREVPDSVISVIASRFSTLCLSEAVEFIFIKNNLYRLNFYDFMNLVFRLELLAHIIEKEAVKFTRMLLFEKSCSTYVLKSWFNAHSSIVETYGEKWLLELSQSIHDFGTEEYHLVNRNISHRLDAARMLALFLGTLPPELECKMLDCPIDLRLFASCLLASNKNDQHLQLLSCLSNEEYCKLLFAALDSPLKTDLLTRMGPYTNTNYPYESFTLTLAQKKKIRSMILSETEDLPAVQKALNLWMDEILDQHDKSFLFLVPALPFLSEYCRNDYYINKDVWEADPSSLPVHRIILTLPIDEGCKYRQVQCWSQEQTRKLWDLAAPDVFLASNETTNTLLWNNYKLDAVIKHIQPTLKESQRQILHTLVDEIFWDLGGFAPFVTKEAFDFFPKNPKLSIRFFLSLQKKPDGTPLLSYSAFENWENVKESEAQQICRFLFYHPHLLTRLTDIWAQEDSIEITLNGKASHTYHHIASVLLKSMQFKPYALIFNQFQEETELCRAVRLIMSGKSRAYRHSPPLLSNLVYKNYYSHSYTYPLYQGAPYRQEALLEPGDYDGVFHERKWARGRSGPVSQNISRNYYREYFFFMEEIAELLLSHSLSLAKKIEEEGRTDWQDVEIVEALANNIKRGHTTVVWASTGNDIEDCRKFSNEGPFNWLRMAKQLLFWLQNDDAGYLGALKKGKLPVELYPAGAKIDLERVKNFSWERGFMTKGHKDIGPFKGPLCLTEFEKMAYTTTILIFGLSAVEM